MYTPSELMYLHKLDIYHLHIVLFTQCCIIRCYVLTIRINYSLAFCFSIT